jgi:Stigma-specific protein, Stig1
MHALRMSRALLLCWAGSVVGCSTVPQEELGVERSAAPLVEGWQAAGSMADTRKFHAGGGGCSPARCWWWEEWTQSRTVTTYSADYASCQCVPSTYTETQPCTLPTVYPYALCNGVCTDVSFDSTNCGRCGNRCITPKFVCSDGFCEQQF